MSVSWWPIREDTLPYPPAVPGQDPRLMEQFTVQWFQFSNLSLERFWFRKCSKSSAHREEWRVWAGTQCSYQEYQLENTTPSQHRHHTVNSRTLSRHRHTLRARLVYVNYVLLRTTDLLYFLAFYFEQIRMSIFFRASVFCLWYDDLFLPEIERVHVRK